MTFALSHVKIDSSGNAEYIPGALFRLPLELCNRHCIAQYSRIKNPGWTQSEFGYWAFAFQDFEDFVVVPGLYLIDLPRPRKKIHAHKAQFSKDEISTYINNHLDWRKSVRERSERELTALIHDLRHLSTSIYHSATEAENATKSRDNALILDKLKSITASQGMLKVRIDYLDYVNSIDRFSEIEDINVYSRMDKVRRCFSSDAKHKLIDIYLTGSSFRLAHGPNILDIVSYTLVENAIKYSPRGGNVEINVEDKDETTVVSVTSTGPRVTDEEVEAIFERGKRGAAAIRMRPSGTGLGLAVAKEIVSIFGGSIYIVRHGEVVNPGVPGLQKISFVFEIPTAGEDKRRKSAVDRVRERRRRKAEARFG